MTQESFGRMMLAVCGMFTAYELTVVIVTLNKTKPVLFRVGGVGKEGALNRGTGAIQDTTFPC